MFTKLAATALASGILVVSATSAASATDVWTHVKPSHVKLAKHLNTDVWTKHIDTDVWTRFAR